MFTDYTSMLTMAGTGIPNFTTVGLSGELADVNSMFNMLGGQGTTATASNANGKGQTSATSNYNNYVDYLNGNTTTNNNATPGNAAAAAGNANGSFDSSNLVANYLKTYFPGMTDEQIAGINAFYDQFYGQLEQQFADFAASQGMSATAAGGGAYGVYSSQYAQAPGVNGMLQDCLSMVGLNEHSNASEINKITSQSGINCATTPWCASWAMTMLKNHGVLDTSSCSNVNYCPTIKSWSQGQGTWRGQGSGYTPQPGDAILFDWDGNGTAQHIGIVQKVENGKVYTIEGNSSDSVAQRTYNLSSGNILGYIDCASQKR